MNRRDTVKGPLAREASVAKAASQITAVDRMAPPIASQPKPISNAKISSQRNLAKRHTSAEFEALGGKEIEMKLNGAIRILLFTLVAAPSAPLAVQAQSDLDSFLDAYTSAWNEHDGHALSGFFTDDADLIMGSLPRIEGREAIGEWWSSYFSRIDSARHGRFEFSSLKEIAPGVRLANLSSTTYGSGSSGGELETRLARGTWVLVRRGDSWLISAMRGLPAEGERRVLPGTDR